MNNRLNCHKVMHKSQCELLLKFWREWMATTLYHWVAGYQLTGLDFYQDWRGSMNVMKQAFIILARSPEGEINSDAVNFFQLECILEGLLINQVNF